MLAVIACDERLQRAGADRGEPSAGSVRRHRPSRLGPGDDGVAGPHLGVPGRAGARARGRHRAAARVRRRRRRHCEPASVSDRSGAVSRGARQRAGAARARAWPMSNRRRAQAERDEVLVAGKRSQQADVHQCRGRAAPGGRRRGRGSCGGTSSCDQSRLHRRHLAHLRPHRHLARHAGRVRSGERRHAAWPPSSRSIRSTST